jgi:8-oxo-dGTP pyrophosphatase MutT (NUDIX family)
VHSQNDWQVLERFVEIRSPWVTLIGEKLQDEQKHILNYWRVEKVDSVVIVTIQNGQFLFPKASYRPGLGQTTLDFPGGRVLPQQTPVAALFEILRRELGITESEITRLSPLNQIGWAINSSFSNQKLYGFVAEISSTVTVESDKLETTYPINETGINHLLEVLTCLQCRALLLEWQRQYF